MRIPTSTALLALTLLAPRLWAQDPFAPGERWRHSSSAASPWIPSGVSFAARGDLIWAGAQGVGGGMWLLHRAAEGVNPPRAMDPGAARGASHLDTVAGHSADALFSLTQSPNPSPYLRRTLVKAYDGSGATRGGALTPRWVHDVGFDTNGSARIASDASGQLVVVAVWNNALSQVQVDWLQGSTGALLVRRTLAAPTLDQLALSADGSITVVCTGIKLLILDNTGTVVHDEPLNSAVHALSISDDGVNLAVGGAGQVAFMQDLGRRWINRFNITTVANEIATAVDLSGDGQVAGVGWWDSSNGVDVRMEVWNTLSGQRTHKRSLWGQVGGLQNKVEVIDAGTNGQRIAFGTWGNGQDAEVFLFDESQPNPVLESALPGSVLDLALDDSGTQMVIGYRDAHRNQPANTGGVALVQSGDRDLIQRDPAESGRDMRVETRWNNGTLSFLLVGQRATPVQYPGVQGLLHLDRTTLAYQWQVPVAGRAQFRWSIPADTALIGTHFASQAAFRAKSGTVFSPHVIDPVILP